MAQIKVYSTQTCPWCHVVKEFLAGHGLEFDEVDVSMDRAAAEEMVSKSGQMGVPQTEINGKMIVGFDRAALEAEIMKLRLNKKSKM